MNKLYILKFLLIVLIIALVSSLSHAQTVQQDQEALFLEFEGNRLHWNLPFPKVLEEHLSEVFSVERAEGVSFFHFEQVVLNWNEKTL